MPQTTDRRRWKIVATLIETFGFSPWFATAVAMFFAVLAAGAVAWIFLSAPPRTITIASGPPGSSFERYAKAYQTALAARGFTLRIVASAGSAENLQRLRTPDSGVDIGFVQGGLVGETAPPDLVSLGSIAYQPLMIFYRATMPIARLSELGGKRIAIGADGSGVQTLARRLLDANGVAGPPTVLLEQASGDAGADLIAGRIDAIFLMGDSAPVQTMRTLMRTPGVQLYHFTQADAYVRRHRFLNKITLPQGIVDFGRNLPAQDTTLVGPTVELIAREGLNSAVCDLLLEAAQKVHSQGGLMARQGEFPAPLERDFTISDDARRFYKSGIGFTHKVVGSFWLGSLINRLLVAIVPIVLVLIPAVRLLPLVYRWSVQLRFYRCYRPLLRLERSAEMPLSAERVDALLHRLDEIERDVNALKVPASFGQQFYDLRRHVVFVRNRLKQAIAG